MHRDLKPVNIKITPDGKVKVLDFGLAKMFQAERMAADASQSPTLVSGMGDTVPGVILGTAAYMSPEQARGREADRTTDIWAFGCVLYEMLTGKQAFGGETITDILGGIVKMDPDWNALPLETPDAVRKLLRRCLHKDRQRRLHDAADARIEIEEAESQPASKDQIQTVVVQARSGRERLAWTLLGMSVILALALSVPSTLYFRSAPPESPEIRLEVVTPPTTDPLSFALSPDGRRLVFVGSPQGKNQLWARPLDSVTAQPLGGTEGATYPFWSADSRSIGFFADGKLKRIDIAGGGAQTLANAVAGRGGAWNSEDVIVFAPSIADALYRVPTGGTPTPLTRLEAGRQINHRFPQFLPDGRHFIYFAQGTSEGRGVYLASLDAPASKRLFDADTAAVVAPPEHLLFVRQGTLFAQRIDLERFEMAGDPFAVANPVAFDASFDFGGLSAATVGILAYRTGGAGNRQLVWFDRSGKTIGAIGNPDPSAAFDSQLSPDGKRVALARESEGNRDVWLVELSRGVFNRFTFEATNEASPMWSPDGSQIVFRSDRRGVNNLYRRAASGAGGEELLLESPENKYPSDWSPDGRFLLYRSLNPKTGYDLWVLPLSGDRKSFPLVTTPFEERDGQFSPDGRWIVYQSTESGSPQIYVQPFPGPGGKWQISTNGGAQPRWLRDAKELFYVGLDGKLMAAPIILSSTGQTLEAGIPISLFSTRLVPQVSTANSMTSLPMASAS